MAWIEVHQSLRDHRKILSLADALDMPEAHVAGHMVYLWLWSLDNAPDGTLPESTRIVERAAGWQGQSGALIAAMAQVGMLDRDEESGQLCIHDWQEYAGRLIEKRKSDAERKRFARSVAGRPTDVPRTTDGQPTDVAGTVPNRTVPNRTDEGNGRGVKRNNVPTVAAAVVGAADAAADVAPLGPLGVLGDGLDGLPLEVADLLVSDTPDLEESALSATARATAPPTPPAPPPKTAREKVIYTRDGQAYQLAQRLADAIRRTKPDARLPSNLQGWCPPMDLLMRRDGRAFEHLCAVLDWLPTNEFWRKNVLSAGTFREKIDRLEMQRDEDLRKREGYSNGRDGRSGAGHGAGPATYRGAHAGGRQLPSDQDYEQQAQEVAARNAAVAAARRRVAAVGT